MSSVEATQQGSVVSYWWVNQNQTYREEVRGGFMWSPKRKSNGARNRFYDNMAEVVAGDIVFSFRATRLSAIGVITGPAETGVKPDFASSSDSWSQDGWVVPVDYVEFENPIRPKDHMDRIGPLLPDKYSPLLASGDGLQSVYLAALPEDLGELLVELTGADVRALRAVEDPGEAVRQEIERFLKESADLPQTEVEQLVKARRGQGTFKSRVQQIETRCRVTGVATWVHLRASHIKPWKASDNFERLDGANGLLLAPHVDHLFDRGWISFADDGGLLVSRHLEPGLLGAWGISESVQTEPFSKEQRFYLDHHRTHVFENHASESGA